MFFGAYVVGTRYKCKIYRYIGFFGKAVYCRNGILHIPDAFLGHRCTHESSVFADKYVVYFSLAHDIFGKSVELYKEVSSCELVVYIAFEILCEFAAF